MESNHPIRNFVEQKLLSDLDTKLGGLQERILRDPYNPFPKIPRSENFPDEFVYVGGLANSFHTDPITSELQYCLFTCPGTLYPKVIKQPRLPAPSPHTGRFACRHYQP